MSLSDPAVPAGLPVLAVGVHRNARAGSCVMEYVSILAGERFTDLPCCTHPAVAALAWQVNDTVSAAARQQLARRAPALVGAGYDVDVPVQPMVLATIARAGLTIDPAHRYFARMQLRLGRPEQRADLTRRMTPAAGLGRLAMLCDAMPINRACAQLWVTACTARFDTRARDRLAITLLDDCLVAVTHPATTSTRDPRAVTRPVINTASQCLVITGIGHT